MIKPNVTFENRCPACRGSGEIQMCHRGPYDSPRSSDFRACDACGGFGVARAPAVVDARREGIKSGLRQLSSTQLTRLLKYDKPMVLDHYNYHEGNFCPLAVALGLPEIETEWTNEKVQAVILALGFKISNTRGVKGMFYTENRMGDLLSAVAEILEERKCQ